MEPKDVKELNIVLRNSFSAIKKDMDILKSGIASVRNASLVSENEMKKDLADLKENSVKADKLNLMKIRLDEINENIAHLYTAVEKVKKMEKDIVTKKDVASIKDDFKKDMTAFVGETGERIDNLRKEVRIAKEKEEKLLSKDEFNGFVSTLNKELDYLRKTIEKTYDIKDTITKRELDTKTESLKEQIIKLNKALEENAKSDRDNLEATKKNASELAELKGAVLSNFTAVKEKLATKIAESQIKSLLTDVNVEFEKVKNDISKVKETTEEIKDLRKSLNELKRSVALEEELMLLQKQLEGVKDQVVTGRDIARMIKTSTPPSRIEKIAKVEEKRTIANGSKFEFAKTLFFANAFIVLSFASLIGALIAFFMKNPAYMDGLSIAAIAWFLVGIMLRIFVIMRRK